MCGNVVSLGEGEEWELSFKAPRPMSSPASKVIGTRIYVAGGWDGRMTEETPERNYWADRQLSSPEVWVADLPERS